VNNENSCVIHYSGISEFKDKEPWTAFRMVKPKNLYPEDMPTIEYIKAVGGEFEKILEEIETREYNESLVKSKTNILYVSLSR